MLFGLAVTALFLWLALRDVPFGELGATLAGARWGLLLGLSVPSYLLMVWLRALRWRHLTDPLQPIGLAPLARAVAVGTMANNVLPLRMGEVIRSWYLARETGASTAGIFGTVVLERVVDALSVGLLALLALGLWEDEGGGVYLRRGALLLLPVALAPIFALAWLRGSPQRIEALGRLLRRLLPARLGTVAASALERFGEGLGALRGGRHLLWIAIHSVNIWAIASVLPVVAALWALDIDLGSPRRLLVAAWATQAAVGVAIALPSAPGFFGIFHFACKLALVPFGVAPEAAVATGTLLHGVMWVTLTALGFAVLRQRRTTLGEVDRATAALPDE